MLKVGIFFSRCKFHSDLVLTCQCRAQLRDDCLRHKVVKTFDPTYRLWSTSTKNNVSSYLRISFESKETEIIEEVDVISFANLLGSIGGYMGMFFGFSISGYVLWLLDQCFNRFSKE